MADIEDRLREAIMLAEADYYSSFDLDLIIEAADSLSTLRTERDRDIKRAVDGARRTSLVRMADQRKQLLAQLATAEREREEWKGKYEEVTK